MSRSDGPIHQPLVDVFVDEAERCRIFHQSPNFGTVETDRYFRIDLKLQRDLTTGNGRKLLDDRFDNLMDVACRSISRNHNGSDESGRELFFFGGLSFGCWITFFRWGSSSDVRSASVRSRLPGFCWGGPMRFRDLRFDISGFTSELFYEGKLESKEETAGQRVNASGIAEGTGLRFLPVEHKGNQNCSPEEADVIAALVDDILQQGATWVDRSGEEHPVGSDDILIIAPYNAQVFEIQQRLPQARVGTVDKFQGQEAPISIYSLASSSHADAPRGMEFLYSLNRLNVATSRAKCVTILVGSPQLFEADCRTPRQMQLANAFCRYRERAL